MATSLETPKPKARKPKPQLDPDLCKGCLRCIDSCNHHCLVPGHDIDPRTGLIPIELHLEACTACGLCFDACPEPYGLRPERLEEIPTGQPEFERPTDADHLKRPPRPKPVDIPDVLRELPLGATLVLKGNHASAIGALLAGCRHFYGYPITPSTEGAELLAKLLPKLNGIFLQAVSEVATVNLMYGTAGAGLRTMTFTSSPGFSLMLEGVSYMIGAELPAVFVNVMRGGPGLGNIAPEQADIKLACRGLGHGNTHAIVFAPSTPQEMLDLTRQAFELAFQYRNPVVLLADGYLGQMTGRVELPKALVQPGLPKWAVAGDAAHRDNLISSIFLAEADLEAHNRHLDDKYARMAREARAESWQCEDAEVVIVACNTPARMARGAVAELRQRGVKAGLFRPITLWPFPIDALAEALSGASRLVVVEASAGQLEDELRLAASHAGLALPPLAAVRHSGGVLPQQDEIVAGALAALAREVTAPTASKSADPCDCSDPECGCGDEE
ncbi:MAG: 3-methyl-2-oxobutanoate dehydrogenase subunit VorB [Vicinamibacteria bacterium]|nr:3-methyl-2-oxobutanoate dehydrogenase subunit VorB [Vicinamibacteria bacterium]